MSRTFVVGLDGASWRLLEPWIASGELPNLRALREEGVWAGHNSCLPPVTFPNWKCYSSGKDPGGFGVYWFERVDLEAGEISTIDSRDYRTAELWDYLNDEGYTTGVVNMPTMYPPREIDGPLVCGGPGTVEGEYRSIDSGYTHPEALATTLEREHEYEVHPDPLISSNEERGEEVEAILDVLEQRFAVALDLFERKELDLVHVTLFYLNVLHHFFWDEEPSKRAWTLVDEWIGRLKALDDVNLVIVSDHGSAPTTTEFYINEWLAEHGYQQRTQTVEDFLRPLGINRENVLALAKRAGLVDPLAAIVPERIQQLVPQSAGIKRARKLDAIDLDRTKAVASSQGPIYINPAFDVDAVAEELIADLESVRDSDGPLFTRVVRGSAVYSGPFTDEGPQVVVDQRPGVHVNDGMGGGNVQTGPDRWAAENTPNGIFVAAGPDFDDRGEIDRISILDVAPTLLATFECDVPSDMRGEVLDVLVNQPEFDQREPLALDDRYDPGQSEKVTDRLEQLGYMS
ncbi:alkaline phosphatase family protein [Halocatena halophila]|uniref:alkaline phosphatase family protein n=1 Tax=Halocatena halophila TaxID=2814576 RepID=UPI002ED2BF09